MFDGIYRQISANKHWFSFSIGAIMVGKYIFCSDLCIQTVINRLGLVKNPVRRQTYLHQPNHFYERVIIIMSDEAAGDLI